MCKGGAHGLRHFFATENLARHSRSQFDILRVLRALRGDICIVFTTKNTKSTKGCGIKSGQ